MRGTVVRSTGSWYDVLGDDGRKYPCRIKGKLRTLDIRITNPVAVGDKVNFETDPHVITDIEPRENYIIRKAVKKSREAHILASNLDQVMLIATVVYPRTSMGFIDRFLVSAEGFRIPQVIVFNKKDLLDAQALEFQQHLVDIYENIGIRCLQISAEKDTDLSDLKELFRDKTTLVGGHSGVGKSTILNRIDPSIGQKTAKVSDFAQKGVHTTTFAEMFIMDHGGRVIDTPGIKELGLIEMEDAEISDYFPEMREVRNDCRFSNCLHFHEPGCAVVAAVEEGRISVDRYESYLSMVFGEDNRR